LNSQPLAIEFILRWLGAVLKQEQLPDPLFEASLHGNILCQPSLLMLPFEVKGTEIEFPSSYTMACWPIYSYYAILSIWNHNAAGATPQHLAASA
jgi:hypothetical protein